MYEALPPCAELVADKGYDSQALREWLDERGTEAVIPPRRNRKVQYEYDRAVYKQLSRTGVASPPASIATSKTSWVPSLSPQPSSGGCSEFGP